MSLLNPLYNRYRLWVTTGEMLQDRGCGTAFHGDVQIELGKATDFDSFLVRFPDGKGIDVRGVKPSGETILVRYLDSSKREEIQEAILASVGNKHLILIVRAARVIPQPIQHMIRDLSKEHGMAIELMEERDCLWNPTKHMYAPRVRVLSKEECERVRARYGLKVDELPQFARDDQMVRYFGWPRGTLVAIDRPTEGAGFTTVIRKVG